MIAKWYTICQTLRYCGEGKGDRIALGSMSGPEMILISRLAWNSKSSCFHHWSSWDYRTGTTADPALSQALNTGLVSRIHRKHELSLFLLLLCSSSKVTCSFWLLEGSQYMSTDKSYLLCSPHCLWRNYDGCLFHKTKKLGNSKVKKLGRGHTSRKQWSQSL